ncbi:unnamed protein product, partial [marine sediment metagenome]
MAQQTVDLNPGQSQQVSFEVVPTEAKVYQVVVDGLTGSFSAIAAPPVTFDPWVYDTNESCYIELEELIQATNNYYA